MLSAIVETVSIAAIIPFLTIATQPNAVLNITYVVQFADLLSLENYEDIVFAFGLLSFCALVIAAFFRVGSLFAQTQYASNQIKFLSVDLLSHLLGHPYEWFLNRNSADLEKTILSEVEAVVGSCVTAIIAMAAHLSLALLILTLLVVIDIKVAGTSMLVICSLYGFVYWILRRTLLNAGISRLQANMGRFQAVKEGLSSLKEVKLNGAEGVFISRLSSAAKTYSATRTTVAVTKQLPKFVIETFAFGGLLIFVSINVLQAGNFVSVVPMVATYAFAGYRLMPSIQGIYSNYASLQSGRASLLKLLGEFDQQIKKQSGTNNHPKVSLQSSLRVEGVSYRYPDADKDALVSTSLNISAGFVYGFVGKTGGGKTTLIDLIIGLLQPHAGRIYIDDIELTPENCKAWQSSVAYVPQNISLVDDTIAANIAFGVLEEDIDWDRLEKVAAATEVMSFVEQRFSNGLKDMVGEGGIRLSGGQRQRIGIARALYKGCSLLVLDEATSALDAITEKKVMAGIRDFAANITILMVAHRINTINNDDVIYILDQGKIRNSGTYAELLESDEDFRRLTNV